MGNKSSQNGNLMNYLTQLGLNQYESRIYGSLLSFGALTAGELAETSNVPRSRVYDVLTSLEKKGFAIPQVGKPIKYIGLPVESAIGSVKSSMDESYRKKIDFVSKLEKDLQGALESHIDAKKKSRETDSSAEFVGILKGKNNVYGHIKHLVSNSKSRILKITNDEGLSNLEKHCKTAFERAKKKGVKTHILANAPSLKSAGKLAGLANFRSHTHGNSGRMLVKDGEEIVLMSGNDNGIWIKNQQIAGILEKLFYSTWEKSKPLVE